MFCERCNERPANVVYTEIINGHKSVSHLCDVCAAQTQVEGLGFAPQINMPDVLASLLSQTSHSQSYTPHARDEISCPVCGTTESAFIQKGLLGCGRCYRHFEAQLGPLMRRIHGSSSHVGKAPERSGGRVRLNKQIKDMKENLKQVIAREEFEQAAHIRDQIRALEQQMSGGE